MPFVNIGGSTAWITCTTRVSSYLVKLTNDCMIETGECFVMFPCLGMRVNCVKVFTGRESVDIHTLHGETSCGGARVFSPQFHLISCEYPQDPLFQSNDCRDLHNWDGNTPYPQGNTLNIVFDFF